MTELLGQMWLPVLLVFVATALITLGLIVHRSPTDQHAPDEDQAEDPDDGAFA